MHNLPKIRLISVSRPKQQWQDIVHEYENRLTKITTYEHIVIKELGHTETETRTRTSIEIEKRIPKNSYVILFDERGKRYTSEEFAQLLVDAPSEVCLILGSSYGVSDELRQRADAVVSLGEMVFAHEIARVIVLEQLYRAHAILTNHPYHHV